MSGRHSALAVLVAVVWGVNFVVIDEGLSGVPPLLLLSMRFVLVALPLVFLVPPPRTGWRTVVGVGTFMSLCQFSLLYLALHLGMPAGLASLVLQAQVVFTIALAAAVLGERPTRQQVLGAFVGMVGLAVVAVGHGTAAPVLPLLITVAGALSWAFGNVLSRRAKVASGLSLVVWSALVVPLPAFGLSLLVDGPSEVTRALTHLPGTAIFATLYTAYAASLLGYAIWNSMLARYPAGAVVPYILLVPVVGIGAAWLVQGEAPDAVELAGGAVMLAGVALATLRTRRTAAEPQTLKRNRFAWPPSCSDA